MSEEKENTAENTEEKTTDEAEAKKAGKSGLMKYIMIGGGAFVLIIVIAVVAMMFLGGDAPPEAEGEEQTSQEETHGKKPSNNASKTDDGHDDAAPAFYDEEELMSESDGPSVLDNITDNLAFLDYQPEEDDIVMNEEEIDGMSIEDSIEAARWLEGEKAALTERENNLATRERDLKILDKKVSQKLLTLEHAKTSRVNSLAKLYDGMDARAVAALMANLDNSTVVSILPRMKTKNASQVLSLFPPKRGANLSKQMITIAETEN